MIAGSLKGRRVLAPPGLRVRPTSDRAREALFDILGPRIIGCRFLDLFSGTGAVGIEARSRGATGVVLVESDRAALEIIDRNLEALGITEGVSIVRAPWPRALRPAAEKGGPFSVVFADPPYAQADYEKILASLAGGDEKDRGLLDKDPLIVLEHEDRSPIPSETPDFRLQRGVVYGRAGFGFYRFRA